MCEHMSKCTHIDCIKFPNTQITFHRIHPILLNTANELDMNIAQLELEFVSFKTEDSHVVIITPSIRKTTTMATEIFTIKCRETNHTICRRPYITLMRYEQIYLSVLPFSVSPAPISSYCMQLVWRVHSHMRVFLLLLPATSTPPSVSLFAYVRVLHITSIVIYMYSHVLNR